MSIATLIPTLAIIVLGGVGGFLMLPQRFPARRARTLQIIGAVALALAVLAVAWLWAVPPDFLAGLFFYGFGLLAIVAAILTVTSRNPVYSALWFALVVLSSSGLFLLARAQFLAVGTIIVYAGAIIVTFLFVIMLAQAEGGGALRPPGPSAGAVLDRRLRGPGLPGFRDPGRAWRRRPRSCRGRRRSDPVGNH